MTGKLSLLACSAALIAASTTYYYFNENKRLTNLLQRNSDRNTALQNQLQADNQQLQQNLLALQSQLTQVSEALQQARLNSSLSGPTQLQQAIPETGPSPDIEPSETGDPRQQFHQSYRAQLATMAPGLQQSSQALLLDQLYFEMVENRPLATATPAGVINSQLAAIVSVRQSIARQWTQSQRREAENFLVNLQASLELKLAMLAAPERN